MNISEKQHLKRNYVKTTTAIINRDFTPRIGLLIL